MKFRILPLDAALLIALAAPVLVVVEGFSCSGTSCIRSPPTIGTSCARPRILLHAEANADTSTTASSPSEAPEPEPPGPILDSISAAFAPLFAAAVEALMDRVDEVRLNGGAFDALVALSQTDE